MTVSGTMSDFREHVTRTRTPYYTFDFGDGTQTVQVVSYEKPPCQAGAAMVEGTFDHVKWRVRVSYSLRGNYSLERDLLPGPRTEDAVNAKRARKPWWARMHHIHRGPRRQRRQPERRGAGGGSTKRPPTGECARLGGWPWMDKPPPETKPEPVTARVLPM